MKYVFKIFPSLLMLPFALTACSPELVATVQQNLKNKLPAADPQPTASLNPQPTVSAKPYSAPVVTVTVVPPVAPSTSPTTITSQAPAATPVPRPIASDDFICFPNAGETVHGKIIDDAGKAMAGVKVSLKQITPEVAAHCPERVLVSTASNSDGNYTFSQGVIGGVRMELQVSNAGFQSQTIPLVPITNRVGDGINRYDFTLKPESKITVKSLLKLPAGRAGVSAVVYKQNLYVIGGGEGTAPYKDLYKIDPVAPALTVVGDLVESLLPFYKIISYTGAAVSLNDNIYLVGGSPGDSARFAQSEIVRLDPATWKSNLIGKLPSDRITYAVAYQDKLYAIGGQANGQILDDILEIDPTTGVSQFIGHLPSPRYGMAVVVYKDLIYAIGGSSFNGSSGQGWSDILTIDPRTGKSQKIGDLPTARASYTGHWATVLNDKIVVVGGSSITNDMPTFYSDILVIDPLSGAISKAGDLPVGRNQHAVVALNDKVYVIGGSTVGGAVDGGAPVSTDVLEINGLVKPIP